MFDEIKVMKKRSLQLFIGWGGVFFLTSFLVIHIYKDLTSKVDAWYFHSTYVWFIVMGIASFIFLYQWKKLKLKDSDINKRFKNLPSE